MKNLEKEPPVGTLLRKRIRTVFLYKEKRHTDESY